MKNALVALLEKEGLKKTKIAYAETAPELALLADKVPTGDDWIFETKFDGYRILAYKDGNKVALLTRNHKQWADRFQNIAEAIRKLPVKSVFLDGEIVAQAEKGSSNFSALQKLLTDKSKTGFKYYVFDLLSYEGFDLRNLTLASRKKILSHLFRDFNLKKSSGIYLTEFVQGDGQRMLDLACTAKMEGVIAKKLSARYVGSRSPDWQKIKCTLQDEFVIGGFTAPQGSRAGFGSLLVGYYQNGKLIYSGRVGTGFDNRFLVSLKIKLDKIRVKDNPFANKMTALEKKGATYVKPNFVAQLAYSEWTADKHLRHPVFLGLREDKKAKEVTLPNSVK